MRFFPFYIFILHFLSWYLKSKQFCQHSSYEITLCWKLDFVSYCQHHIWTALQSHRAKLFNGRIKWEHQIKKVKFVECLGFLLLSWIVSWARTEHRVVNSLESFFYIDSPSFSWAVQLDADFEITLHFRDQWNKMRFGKR